MIFEKDLGSSAPLSCHPQTSSRILRREFCPDGKHPVDADGNLVCHYQNIAWCPICGEHRDHGEVYTQYDAQYDAVKG